MGIRSINNTISSFRGRFERTGREASMEYNIKISATGGTKTTVGSYTIHTFTAPGSLVISSGNDFVEYLVVAGGGGGYNSIGNQNVGGGGAGGLRSNHPAMPSPLISPTLVLTPGTYPVSVGGGGNGGQYSPSNVDTPASRGGDSTFHTITSNGGGGAGNAPLNPGGSGAGGFATAVGGTGNTPPTSPPQGNPGGDGNPYNNSNGSGGGGAGGSGNPAAGPGLGGSGITIDFPGGGSPTTYAAGGNGSSRPASPLTANTGNGGYSTYQVSAPGPNGASGIVIVRYLK